MTINAIRQYQQTQAIEPARSGSNGGRKSPQARLTSRTVGFSLGKLGIEFSSSDIQLDDSLSLKAAEARRKASSFGAERHVETLRADVARQAVADRAHQAFERTQRNGGPSMLARRLGAAAYEQTSSPEPRIPGSMFTASV